MLEAVAARDERIGRLLTEADETGQWVYTHTEIAREFGLSVGRIGQIGATQGIPSRGCSWRKPGQEQRQRAERIVELSLERKENGHWKYTYDEVARKFGITAAWVSRTCLAQGHRRFAKASSSRSSDEATLHEIHAATFTNLSDSDKLQNIREVLDKRFSD
jgi:transposase-like protein